MGWIKPYPTDERSATISSPMTSSGGAAQAQFPFDVSVVICTYTEARFGALRRAVLSALDQSLTPRQVVIVVDHNEVLLARVRQEFPAVIAVPSAGPKGLSGARNTGVAVSAGDFVAFLDDDASADSGWLAALTTPYRDVDVLGTGGGADPDWEVGRPRWLPPEFDWVVGCSYVGLPSSAGAVRNPLGCSMSFRRDVFSTVGGFRSDVGRIGTRPIGCEETELSIRALRHWPQGSIIYVPDSRVLHSVPASRSTWGYFIARCFAEGRSKSTVTRSVGVRRGLAAERRYALWTLPRGILSHTGATLFRRDPYGLVRAGAIVVGLLVTAAGYLTGRLGARPASDQQPAETIPPAQG